MQQVDGSHDVGNVHLPVLVDIGLAEMEVLSRFFTQIAICFHKVGNIQLTISVDVAQKKL